MNKNRNQNNYILKRMSTMSFCNSKKNRKQLTNLLEMIAMYGDEIDLYEKDNVNCIYKTLCSNPNCKKVHTQSIETRMKVQEELKKIAK